MCPVGVLADRNQGFDTVCSRFLRDIAKEGAKLSIPETFHVPSNQFNTILILFPEHLGGMRLTWLPTCVPGQ